MSRSTGVDSPSITANMLWALSTLGVTYDPESNAFSTSDGVTFPAERLVEAASHQSALQRSAEVMATHSLPELVRKMVEDIRGMTGQVRASKLVGWLRDLDARLDEYLMVLDNIVEKKV